MRQINYSENRLWIVVCSVAILCGFISFFITVQLYDTNSKNKTPIAMDTKKQDKVSDFSVASRRDEIIVAQNEANEVSDALVTQSNEETFATKDETSKVSDVLVTQNYEESFVTKSEVRDTSVASTDDINILNDVIATQNTEDTNEIIEAMSTTIDDIQNNKQEETPYFQKPLEGTYGMEYREDTLIYSKTLDEWIVHPGIDIIAEESDPVKAIADGTITEIKMDPRYGNTIIMSHENGYKSIYANLCTTELVYVGMKIHQGDIISGVGKGFGFESAEEPHVHLEIWQNNKTINPLDLIEK